VKLEKLYEVFSEKFFEKRLLQRHSSQGSVSIFTKQQFVRYGLIGKSIISASKVHPFSPTYSYAEGDFSLGLSLMNLE
jgi:hypothetical protein